MHSNSRRIPWFLAILILTGTLASLFAAYRRFHVEMGNRRVEIAVEWAEVSELAQVTHTWPKDILTAFKAQHVSTLVLAEETLEALEQEGRLLLEPVDHDLSADAQGQDWTKISVPVRADFDRIRAALERRYPAGVFAPAAAARPKGTLFSSQNSPNETFSTPLRYATLRTLGIGLPTDGVAAANVAGMTIAGRVANFPGINAESAEKVLRDLKTQGATTVIFSGEEVLGFRGVEKSVAELFRSPDSTHFKDATLPPLGLHYGAVEFGKQKGDAKISTLLAGDVVRVHSIQVAEMAQLDEGEIVDRFVRAARERNIRFCYVRLLPIAGDNPVAQNTQFLSKIANGMARGRTLTGGGMGFGASRPFDETGVPSGVFVVVALGVAAGVVWMLRSLCPLSGTAEIGLLVAMGLLCVGCVLALGETGRKVVALFAGIAFPMTACLLTFPREKGGRSFGLQSSMARAMQGMLFASAITSLGIAHVIGLLASRPFMTHTNQFLGIKAQHAIPLLIIAFVALIGGAAHSSETWAEFWARVEERLRSASAEPARFGLLLLGIVALGAFMLLVARTGNDAGVGVSGFEMKFRAFLDRALPVRPRTKEFLVGHPAFILGLLWWWRGRRKLALPCLVIGSLGQVSLLNTFCHIHSPLLVSVWRGGLGLVFGAALGLLLFLAGELFLFRKANEPDRSADSSEWKSAVTKQKV